MDKEAVRKLLPETPPKGLIAWTRNHCGDELGPAYMVYASEMVSVYPDLAELMEYNDTRPRRRVRAARCFCASCREDFVTRWIPGVRGIRVIEGEDGQIYSADPGGAYPTAGGTAADLIEGDTMTCPNCQQDVQLIRAGALRGGRTKQILVVAVQTVGRYAAVVYWMVRRRIESYGCIVDAWPRDAYVIGEKGNLVRFTHSCGGGLATEADAGYWRECSGNTDTIHKAYHDWGSTNNKKVGGFLYPVVPDLTGTTGERTGLAAFCAQESEYLVSYLRVWKKCRAVENLVNLGWGKLIKDVALREVMGYSTLVELNKVLDISKKKPHEMLGMGKAEFRELRKRKKAWDFETQELYRWYRKSGFSGGVVFAEQLEQFGISGMRAVLDLQRLYGDVTFDKVERYLAKQDLRPQEAGLLLDTRNMAKRLAGNRTLSAEELWPRNLVAVHDRLSGQLAAKENAAVAARYQAGFDKILEQYGCLQWNDGALCVVLPKCNGDLIREGKVLRHCVGGYGAQHIDGSHVIFFIRHYRRPERCYYTLDINMLGTPKEQQLHGYGNERHGPNKQYAHKIPRRVREFCDRWEREILLPWYAEQQRKEKSKNKERKTA